VRLFATLDHLANDADTGRFQQLNELGELVALGQRGDAERALTRARRLRIGVLAVERRRL
jgi:hypothetical protein